MIKNKMNNDIKLMFNAKKLSILLIFIEWIFCTIIMFMLYKYQGDSSLLISFIGCIFGCSICYYIFIYRSERRYKKDGTI